MAIYPKVTGSISDADVQKNAEKYNGATSATEDMLTPDLLAWTLGATVGTKYSKQFALNKQAQKVKYNAADIVADDTTGGSEQTGGGNQGGNTGGENEGA